MLPVSVIEQEHEAMATDTLWWPLEVNPEPNYWILHFVIYQFRGPGGAFWLGLWLSTWL